MVINGLYELNNLDHSKLKNVSTLEIHNCKTISESTFYGLKNLKNVIITDVEVIEAGAFMNCENLEILSVNTDIKNIEEFAFYNTKISFCLDNYINLNLGVGNKISEKVKGYLVTYTSVKDEGIKCKEFTSVKDLRKFTFSNPFLKTIKISDNYVSLNTNVDNNNTYNSIEDLFYECENLIEVDLKDFNMSGFPSICGMFEGCVKLEKVYLPNKNAFNGTDMSYMFFGCENLKEISWGNIDTFNITSMEAMFRGCLKLNKIDLSNFITSKVENMNYMFANCYNLEEVNLTNFDISNAKRTNYMFLNCSKLKEIHVSKSWNINMIKSCVGMFKNCPGECI